jgi:ankyrin repeat protein
MVSLNNRQVCLVVAGLLILLVSKAGLLWWERQNLLQAVAPKRGSLPLSRSDGFLRLAESGDVAGVRREISAGFSVNTCNEDGETAMSLALKSGAQEVIDLCFAEQFCPTEEYRDRNAQLGFIGDVALYRACEKGRIDVVKTLLERGAVPIGQKTGSHQPIVAAVQGKHYEIVRLLLAHGAIAAKTVCIDGMTRVVIDDDFPVPLISYTIKAHDLNTLKTLLKFGVSFVDRWSGFSRLPIAVEEDWPEGVQALLNAGANPETRNSANRPVIDLARSGVVRSLLWAAIAKQHFSITSWPLAQKNAASTMASSFYREENLSASQLVANADLAVLRTTDDRGWTLLFYAIHAGRPELAEALINVGAQANHLAQDGLSPAGLAVAQKDIGMLECLGRGGANFSLSGEGSLSPLALAVRDLQPIIVDWLLRQGVQPECQIKQAYTPLMFAAKQGDGVLMQRLLVAGSDPSATDLDGWPVVFHAALGRNPETVRVLEKYGVNLEKAVATATPLLVVAVQCGDLLKVRGLLQLGVRQPPDILVYASENRELIILLNEFSQRNGDARAAEKDFWAGTARRSPDEVAAFLDNKGDPNFRDEQTPLQLAVCAGRMDLVRLLIDRRADPNALGMRDNTPILMHVVRTHNLQNDTMKAEMIALLLGAGADPNAIDTGEAENETSASRVTALMQSVHAGYIVTTKELLGGGADVTMRDSLGQTAIEYLEKAPDVPSSDKEVIHALLEKARRVRQQRNHDKNTSTHFF